jgi:hypothetical protein
MKSPRRAGRPARSGPWAAESAEWDGTLPRSGPIIFGSQIGQVVEITKCERMVAYGDVLLRPARG